MVEHNPRLDEPGYHLTNIDKGVVGEPSKILEEVQEFIDATNQNCSVMALIELSDLYGAIKAYLIKYHPSITMNDLETMSLITERVFKNGRRC